MMIEYMRQEPPDEVEYYECSYCGAVTHVNDLTIISRFKELYACDNCVNECKGDE
jgi:transposase